MPLVALDVPGHVLCGMAADPAGWLGEDEFAWRAVKEKLVIGAGGGGGGGAGAGYASAIREELRDMWEWEEGSSSACWLFSVREEKGFLLQWPVAGGRH